MENSLMYLISTITVLAMIYAFFKLIKDAKAAKVASAQRNNILQYTDSYMEMFKTDSKVKKNQKGLFDFDTIQSREALLKRNTGKNLCTDCEKIEYVEYFPTIKYKNIRW